MAKRDGAGRLRSRVTFQKKETIDDGLGGSRGDWVDQFTVPAALEPKFGGNAETIIASRLDARQPYNLIVRSHEAARQVTAAWRVYDVRAGVRIDEKGVQRPNRVFGIKTIVNPDGRNAYLEMLVIEGEEG